MNPLGSWADDRCFCQSCCHNYGYIDNKTKKRYWLRAGRAYRHFQPRHPMTGIPMERTQKDGAQKEYSDAAGIDTGTDGGARQEFKDEADINILLSRFGINTQVRTDGKYGAEIDYNLDLQQAYAAIESARRATSAVPEELREKYPTWREMLNATETGEYQHDLQNLADWKAKELAEAEEKAKLSTSEPNT